MKPKTKPASPASYAPLSPMKDQTPDAGFMGDFQDLFSLAMDQVIGIEKASLAAVVRLNSDAMDSSMNALWFSPAFGDLFNTAAQAFASCMELHMSLLTMMATHFSDTVKSISDMQAQLAEEVLPYSMDIALGERFIAPSHTVMTSTRNQDQPITEAPVSIVEIAIGVGAS